MIYKVFISGDGIIMASRLTVLPNLAGGIRSIRLQGIDTCWTGFTHLHIQGTIDIRISDLHHSIDTRSSLDESDEEWQTLVTIDRHGLWTYKYWGDLANELESLVKSWPPVSLSR